MQVILIKDIDNLGATHEVVSVRPGYARNFLIPQKFAIEASPSNLKIADEKAKVKAKKEAALLSEINKVTEVLKASPVKVGAKTGTSGKIFGSVTSIQIARAIKEQKGYEVFLQNCNACHTEPLFSSYSFSNNGLSASQFLFADHTGL